jgi:hypothetical protein
MTRSNTFILLFLAFAEIGGAQSSRDWSTYYGSTGEDVAWTVDADAQGNSYVAGYTYSDSGFFMNGFQTVFGGEIDAFLVKFDSSGNRVWATYYGGSGKDRATSLVVDAIGNIYLSGYTDSDSNIASGGFQNTYGGGDHDIFIVKFDASGNRLWSTYFGGPDDEAFGTGSTSNRITLDNSGHLYLAGNTKSTAGISHNGFQNTFAGTTVNAFLAKFDTSGTRIWSTYYGAYGHTHARDVATDANGNVFITGWTSAYSAFAYNGFQNNYGGGNDAFVAKFDPAGYRLWATYYGGASFDVGNSIAVDAGGNVYVSGFTASTNGIGYSGFQNTYRGGYRDAFIAKFHNSGAREWATYFGGPADDQAYEIDTDLSGNIYISGDTYSATGISFGGFQDTAASTASGFVAKFTSGGNRLCATYFGRSFVQENHMATGFGSVYLCGGTTDLNGISSGGYQDSLAGGFDAFLVKFNVSTSLLPVSESQQIVVSVYPNPASSQLTLKNNSEKPQPYFICNAVGQLLLSGITSGSETQINIGELPAGTYFLRIGDEVSPASYCFVKIE